MRNHEFAHIAARIAQKSAAHAADSMLMRPEDYMRDIREHDAHRFTKEIREMLEHIESEVRLRKSAPDQQSEKSP